MKSLFTPHIVFFRNSIIFITFMTLVGCGMLPTAPPSTPQAPPQVLTSLDLANKAYALGDMAQAEQLYGRAMQDPAIPASLRNRAWEPYILASLASNHPYSASVNMGHWKKAVPDSTLSNAWQRTWLKALAGLPTYEQTQRARLATQQNGLTERVLAQTLVMTQGNTLPVNFTATIAQFTQNYAGATKKIQAGLERAVFNALQYSSGANLFQLLAQTNSENDHVFPWTIVLLESLRRSQIHQGIDIATLRGRINYPSLFADPSLLSAVLKTRLSENAMATPKSLCITLALPMSGPYSSVAWKISQGASAAQAEHLALGQQLELLILNTDQPDWLERLAALPPQCVSVGGALQPTVYAAAKQRGLLQNRAFFTFSSGLEGNDEGTLAWRFFSSQADQIRTNLQFTQALGLQQYSVLAPEEPYGQRMTALFTQQFPTPIPTATYNPADSTTWNTVTADFIGVKMEGDVPIPQSTMQAVFMPDTWKNVEIMIPYVLFQGEDRLVFMGTTLWEQGLNASQRTTIQSVQLAIFPGMWNPANSSPKTTELIASMQASGLEAPDLWVALGFDFVRLAARLQLPPSFTPDLVNHRLVQAQNMPWSMAPITWTMGKASQQLFLFTPTVDGFKEANLEVFSKRLQAIYKRFERRVKKAKKDAEEEAKKQREIARQAAEAAAKQQ